MQCLWEQPEETEGHTVNPEVGEGNKVSKIREKSVHEVLDQKGFLAESDQEGKPGTKCSWNTNYRTQESLLWEAGPGRG